MHKNAAMLMLIQCTPISQLHDPPLTTPTPGPAPTICALFVFEKNILMVKYMYILVHD